MNIIPYYSICLLLIMCSITSLYAQEEDNECVELEKAYNQANQYLTEGNILEAYHALDTLKPEKTKNCRDTEINVYFLRAKILLLQGKEKEAEKDIEKILKLKPIFEVNEELELIDMVYFLKRFEAIPRHSFVLTGSALRTSLIEEMSTNSIEAIITNHENNSSPITDSMTSTAPDMTIDTRLSSNISFGGHFDYNYFFRKKIQIGGGIGYNTKSYSIDKIYSRHSTEESTEEILSISERQRWLTLSGTIRYNFDFGRFTIKPFKLEVNGLVISPFVGYEGHCLLSARFDFARRGGFDLLERLEDLKNTSMLNNSGLEEYVIDKQGGDGVKLNMIDFRNRLNYGFFGGLRMKYRPSIFVRDYLVLDVKMGWMQNSFIAPNRANSIATQEIEKLLVYGLGYIEDPLKFRYTQISIGYAWTLF